MKRLLLPLLWAMIATLPVVTRAQAYARMPVAPPPPWAPPGHARAQYYYLPDLQMYYDVPAASFLLPHWGQWITLRQLPPMYRSYDLYAAPKVVLDNYGPYPFQHYEVHRQRFPRWYCPPHSVVVFRNAPSPAAPQRYLPGRRYRHCDEYRQDCRHDNACNDGCTHEHYAHSSQNGEGLYDSYNGNEDRPYAPGRRNAEPEHDYYYDQEEAEQAGSPRRWR